MRAAEALSRHVVDLGNSRLKWARLDPDGRPGTPIAPPIDDDDAWAAAFDVGPGSTWAIASVNPPAAARLADLLRARGVERVTWYASAAAVPVRHRLERPETAGADRALAVLAAAREGGPGLVVSCGTAITVERVGTDGVWDGGAIAPGLSIAARALRRHTAQLPHVEPGEAPPPWGRSTEPALAAGVFWGAVGSIRELIARQSEGLEPTPWRIWTGGDAPRLAPHVDGPDARVVPDLVLIGLARAAFGRADR